MGGGMAQLFAENGLHVSLSDPSDQAINYVVQQAKNAGIDDRIHKHRGSHLSNHSLSDILVTFC